MLCWVMAAMASHFPCLLHNSFPPELEDGKIRTGSCSPFDRDTRAVVVADRGDRHIEHVVWGVEVGDENDLGRWTGKPGLLVRCSKPVARVGTACCCSIQLVWSLSRPILDAY